MFAIENGPANADVKHINLTVRNPSNNQTLQFKIKKHTTFKKLFATYCDKNSLNKDVCRFHYEGSRLQDSNTPLEYEMEDGDVIECNPHMDGGGVGEGMLD